MPVAQITEQEMKDMNREQVLDQYEDHDHWLDMFKQDFYSFNRLLEKEQTDQKRKVCIISFANETIKFLSQTPNCL